jgi:RNA polymerase sigma factor (TIGR02999 family)
VLAWVDAACDVLTLMTNPVTELLKRLNGGDRSALDELIPLVYRELHKIAEGYFRRESPGHTLQPTSLIHEAYLRLVQQPHPEYQNRAHFYGVAARVMRQILVDHARSTRAAKRGGGETISLGENPDVASDDPVEVLAIDEALERLAGVDRRKVDLVEMRFFGGMTAEEIAECSALPVHTVRRQLRLAQAWLHKELNP